MTNPTLERAARAVCNAGLDTDYFENAGPSERRRYYEIARAVLMAVREMPIATQNAIFDDRDGFVHKIDIPAVWELGIDAILNDGEGE